MVTDMKRHEVEESEGSGVHIPSKHWAAFLLS